eukprot:6196946-Pleurochrysis_carterae.AAC.2
MEACATIRIQTRTWTVLQASAIAGLNSRWASCPAPSNTATNRCRSRMPMRCSGRRVSKTRKTPTGKKKKLFGMSMLANPEKMRGTDTSRSQPDACMLAELVKPRFAGAAEPTQRTG